MSRLVCDLRVVTFTVSGERRRDVAWKAEADDGSRPVRREMRWKPK